MQEFSLYTREGEFDAFTDLLFNALLGFAFMFFIAFILIKPEDASGKIDTHAEFLVTVVWPDSHPDDIDTYVEDPAGNLVWYHGREAGLMHLDRDDRGNYRDTIVVDGTPIENPLNQETVTLRGIVPGEYVVNIFHYSATTNEPVPVHVKIEKLNPTVTVLYYETINLNRTGQEETVARFVIDESGDIKDVNTRDKSLVRLSRKGPTEPQSAPPVADTLMPDGTTEQSRGVILDP